MHACSVTERLVVAVRPSVSALSPRHLLCQPVVDLALRTVHQAWEGVRFVLAGNDLVSAPLAEPSARVFIHREARGSRATFGFSCLATWNLLCQPVWSIWRCAPFTKLGRACASFWLAMTSLVHRSGRPLLAC